MTAFREPTNARPAAAVTHRRWHELSVPLALFCGLAIGIVTTGQLDRGEPGWLLALGLGLSAALAVAVHVLLRQRAVLTFRERRFRDFAEAGSHWFWEMGPDLRFTWLSPNIRSYTGVAAEWYYGK